MKRKTKNIIKGWVMIVIAGVLLGLVGYYMSFGFKVVSAKEVDIDYMQESGIDKEALYEAINKLNENSGDNKSNEDSDVNGSNDSVAEPVEARVPFTSVNLLRTATNKVESLDIDKYIEGVVAAEMKSDFNIEALKAQAVISRGYTFATVLNSSKHKGDIDICDNHRCCQAYKETKADDKVYDNVRKAVKETRGLAPLLAGEIVETLYFAATSEGTLTNAQVWGNTTKSTSIYKELEGPSPESKIMPNVTNEYPYTKSTFTLTLDSFVSLVNSKYPKAGLTVGSVKDKVKILSRTKGGFVEKIQLGNVTISGTDARYKLLKDLKSSNFEFEIKDNNIVFYAEGFGHGVGMSQWGAHALGEEGKDFKEIINYYFNNLTIEKLY